MSIFSRVIESHNFEKYGIVSCDKISSTLKKSITKISPSMVGCADNYKVYSLERLWESLSDIDHEPIDAYVIGRFKHEGVSYIKIDF